jgi:UDP-N-acetylmuramoyl-tripeptide--D-alanyl-D-alanine ligase
MNLGLRDLQCLTKVKIINGSLTEKTKFAGVSIDSRSCKSNELFFAIKGERFDGHDFVKDLGTKCAVVSENWFSRSGKRDKSRIKYKTLIIVPDTIKALGELANIYRRKFAIPVLAIGGSNGKTTAKDMIANVLSKKYRVLKTEGNQNNELGVPLTLFRLNKSHDMAVIELGTNHFGEIKRLCKIAEPQFGLLTNIGKEHLEFLNSISGAAKAEGELVDYLGTRYGTFLMNSDDKYIKAIAKGKEIKVFTYGSGKNVNVGGRITEFRGFYPRIKIKYGNSSITTTLGNIGYQSFYAAISAAAAGFYFSVPVRLISGSLAGDPVGSGKRNQLLNINGVHIVDDTYNSNPDSVIAALENLKAYKTKSSKYVVLGDMLELGKSSSKEHRDAGRLVKKMRFENLYTYGENSYQTFRGAKGVKNNYYFQDKDILAEMLKLNIRKGDIVLVKGSRGMKMEEVIELLKTNNRNRS